MKAFLGILVVFIAITILVLLLVDDLIISLIFKHLKWDNQNNHSKYKLVDHFSNPSVLIGYAERIIMLYFLYMNQLTAIGIIVTAKAILRYNRNDNNQHHNEYITLGTLMSITLAIINFIILKVILRVY